MATSTPRSPSSPRLGFTPDGTKLAATVKQGDVGAIRIWAVPRWRRT